MHTVKEAATLLGLKPGSVRTFIKRGMIVATKRGRDWFITQDEIDRYNRERRTVGRTQKTRAHFGLPRHIKLRRCE